MDEWPKSTRRGGLVKRTERRPVSPRAGRTQLVATSCQVQQYKIGHQVEQQHPDFVDRYTQVVDDIEVFHGEGKPAIMQPVYSIVGKHKGGKPDDDDQIVDG